MVFCHPDQACNRLQNSSCIDILSTDILNLTNQWSFVANGDIASHVQWFPENCKSSPVLHRKGIVSYGAELQTSIFGIRILNRCDDARGRTTFAPSQSEKESASQDFDKNLTALLLSPDLFCSIGLRQHFSWKCGSDFLFNIFLFKSFFILQSNPHVDGLQFQTLAFPIISVSKVSWSG